MNQELGVDGEEASDGSEDSETGCVLHQYEDVYKLRCLSELLNIEEFLFLAR